MTRKHWPIMASFSLLGISGLLAGCSNATFGPQPATSQRSTVGQEDMGRWLNVTPFSHVSDPWRSNAARGGDFDGAYTRLVVLQEPTDPGNAIPSDLPYHDRTVLERYVLGKEFLMNLTVLVSAGDFKATVPLLTLEHISNGDVGEQWSRAPYSSYEAYPFFAVTAETATPIIETILRGSVAYTSHVAADALQIAIGAVKTVAPQATAVTALTKAGVKAKADAIDVTIGKLFGKGIVEDHKGARDLVNWSWRSGYKVTMYIPSTEDSFDTTDPAYGKHILGAWTITFDDPRPSLFSEWRVCHPMSTDGVRPVMVGAKENSGATAMSDGHLKCAGTMETAKNMAYADVRPSTVLDFPLAGGDKQIGRIGQFLSQQSWYTASIAKLGDKQLSARAAGDFCRQIANTIRTVGLNEVDAGIVVWAVMVGQENIPRVVDPKTGSSIDSLMGDA